MVNFDCHFCFGGENCSSTVVRAWMGAGADAGCRVFVDCILGTWNFIVNSMIFLLKLELTNNLTDKFRLTYLELIIFRLRSPYDLDFLEHLPDINCKIQRAKLQRCLYKNFLPHFLYS